MKIGSIEANKGEKAYGFFKTGETHGRFPVQIPLHIVKGAKDGPTLVVQSGVSGLEIEPALVLPHIVKDLDPAKMKGTLVMVPLMNMSGFEFEQAASVWDNKLLNSLGRGKEDGTVSEAMIYHYYQTVIAQADALVDIRTGSQWGYYRYAGVYNSGNVEKSTQMAASLGMEQVLLGQQPDQSMAFEAAQDGKLVVVPFIGGGPGLRDNREQDQSAIRNAVLNAMRYLGMLADPVVYESDQVSIISAHSVIKQTGERGFTFMNAAKRGQQIEVGESIGYVRHPFTGETLQQVTAPRAGIMLHAGASWPVPLEDEVLAILGDLKEVIQVSS